MDEAGTREERAPGEATRDWVAPDEDGCTITPTSTDNGLDQGPWRRTCDAAATP